MTRQALSVADFQPEREVVDYHDRMRAKELIDRITPYERRIFKLLGLGTSRSETGRAVKRSPQTISNSLFGAVGRMQHPEADNKVADWLVHGGNQGRMPSQQDIISIVMMTVLGPENPERSLGFSEKVNGQMPGRGWTSELVGETVTSPAETHPVWDYTAGNRQAATAYVRANGSYVVVNDSTHQIVQVSDRGDAEWQPVWNDPRFRR